MTPSNRITFLFCLALPLAFGCGTLTTSSASLTVSAESSLESITDVFESSSTSSVEAELAYIEDMRVFTAAFMTTSRGDSAFVDGIGAVAEEYGIVNWEGVPQTYVAIGQGLQEAGLDVDEAQAFCREIFGEDARIETLIENTYSS